MTVCYTSLLCLFIITILVVIGTDYQGIVVNPSNSDLYRINITNDPKCQCGAPYEDSSHYLMECPLYQNERYCFFRNLRETNKNIEKLLFGNDENNINENSNIFNKVRAYIRQTKRF